MDLLTIDPDTTLREAAQWMSERDLGAALVVEPTSGSQPAIITERDMLHAIAEGQDPDSQRVGDKTTADVVTASVDSSLEEAVEKMMGGDFRHLLVIQGTDVVGLVSMRDVALALASQ